MIQRKKEQIKKLERELILNKFQAIDGKHQLVLILDHLKSGFNIGKIIRTAEAFSLREVHIIGTKFFDPYPAKGAIKRVKLFFYQTLNESLKKLFNEGYEVFLMDMNAGHFIHERKMVEKTAFIFGNEEVGPILDNVDITKLSKTKIQQFGLTESLNVSIAASIASYEYVTQLSKSKIK